MNTTQIRPDALEGWEYDLESPSAEEIRARVGGEEVGPKKLRIEQWRLLVDAIERLSRLASLVVDPESKLASRDGHHWEVGAIQAMQEAVSRPWSEPPGFDRGLAIRSVMGELAIAAGIQEQLDVREEGLRVESRESRVES